jgi:hypothetical protein
VIFVIHQFLFYPLDTKQRHKNQSVVKLLIYTGVPELADETYSAFSLVSHMYNYGHGILAVTCHSIDMRCKAALTNS